MQRGQRVTTTCRHCRCETFRDDGDSKQAATAEPAILARYPAWTCESCGSRYTQPYQTTGADR